MEINPEEEFINRVPTAQDTNAVLKHDTETPETLSVSFRTVLVGCKENKLLTRSKIVVTAHPVVAGYLGSKRFAAAATDNTPARITSNKVYEPVESKARPNNTGPVAPAAA
jgi:hypothetical protein